jgi:hypothetical protein
VYNLRIENFFVYEKYFVDAAMAIEELLTINLSEELPM